MDPLDPAVTEALRAWQTQHEAGVGTVDALKTSAALCRHGGACFENAARAAAGGAQIERVLDCLAPIVPPAERAMIAASWAGGRAAAGFDSVVSQREMWHALRKKIRAGMLQPAFVLVLACIISPLPAYISSGDGFIYG